MCSAMLRAANDSIVVTGNLARASTSPNTMAVGAGDYARGSRFIVMPTCSRRTLLTKTDVDLRRNDDVLGK